MHTHVLIVASEVRIITIETPIRVNLVGEYTYLSYSDAKKIAKSYTGKEKAMIKMIKLRTTTNNGQTNSGWYYTNSIIYGWNGHIQGVFLYAYYPNYRAMFIEFRSSGGESVVIHNLD